MYYVDENGEEREIAMLEGVGVRDTENGLKITLKGVDKVIIGAYNVEVDYSKYDEDTLYELCYEISKRVNAKYYENLGNITKEEVEKIVHELI